jgi:four helix bundle protein
MPDYRKLLAWQKARALAVSVYRAVGESEVKRDFGLRDQVLRSAVSIASNIAEGYARETTEDRTRFLTIARGSCAELETQLFIAEDAGLLDPRSANALRKDSEEVSKMVYALREALRHH